MKVFETAPTLQPKVKKKKKKKVDVRFKESKQVIESNRAPDTAS